MASTISAAVPALVSAQRVFARVAEVPAEIAEAVSPSLEFLVGKGFLARHPVDVLPHLERHVKAVGVRLDMAETTPDRHRQLTARLARSEETVEEACAALRRRPGGARASRELRWLLAEYRVGLFAQSLGTARPVSAERIEKAVASALAPRARR